MVRPKLYFSRLILWFAVCVTLEQVTTATMPDSFMDAAIKEVSKPRASSRARRSIKFTELGYEFQVKASFSVVGLGSSLARLIPVMAFIDALLLQNVPWRQLQQTDPGTDIAMEARNIATQEGYDGVLSDGQLLDLYRQYLRMFTNRGIEMTVKDCAALQGVVNGGSYLLDATAGNFAFQNCRGTELKISQNMTLQNVIIFNNTGRAIIEVDPNVELSLQNVIFLGNSGSWASGVFANENSQVSGSGLIMHGNAQRVVGISPPKSAMLFDSACLNDLTDSTFVGNGWPAAGGGHMPDQGSAIWFIGQNGVDNELDLDGSPNCNMLLEDNLFRNNVANQDGGALYLINARTVKLIGNVFDNNKAVNGFGGAAHIGETLFALLNLNTMTNNRAREGGALNMQVSSSVTGSDIFINNAADMGGAMQSFGNDATLYNETFIGNTATKLGGALHAAKFSAIYITDSTFDNNSGGTGGAAAIDAYNYVSITNSHFDSNSANMYSTNATQCSAGYLGGGGALCINTVLVGLSDSYGLNLTNCTFHNNSATNGGAVLFPVLCDSDTCASVDVGGSLTSFSNNVAVGGSGSDMWLADLVGSLYSDCDGSESYNTTGELCPQWITRTSVGSPPLPPSLASAATDLVVGDGNNSMYFKPESRLGNSLVSSTVTPMVLDVGVLLVDELGHPIVTGSSDANATITASINDTRVKFIGSPVVLAKAGLARFDTLAIKAPAGEYYLTFIALSASGRRLNANITITVRTCRVGEVQPNKETTNDECMPCKDANQYSFNPTNKSCDTCPTNAFCGYENKSMEMPPDGPIGAVLVPLPGYWHSSPRSPQVHLCPFPRACTGSINSSDTQRTALADYQKKLVINGVALQDINITEYNALQCREGQYGNVCGGCIQGYGRRDEGECVKCPESSFNSFVLFVAILIRIFMVGLTISSQLQAFKDDCDDAEPTDNHGQAAAPKLLTSNGTQSHESHHITTMPSVKTLTVEQRVERCFGTDTSAVKILVNYLQITAILKGVTLELPPPILRLLSAAGVVSNGVQSWFSIDCSMFHTSTPKSIQATVVSIVIPIGILVFTLPFWVLWWHAVVRRKPNAIGLRPYLSSRMRITALAVSFYFYPQLVDSILSIFSCKQLDTEVVNQVSELDDVQSRTVDATHNLLTAVGMWWTSDYNLQCYKGQHLVLMLALGIPGILIICIGIPVWSMLFLRVHKKHRKEMHFAATYALVYADYRDEFYFWESLVMLRKFVLVVLAVSIGTNTPVLKLLACLAWIEAFTIIVVAAKPFRVSRMERLERVSHWGNAFTVIFLALFFIEPENEELKVFSIVSLVLGNTAVILYMVLQIFRESLYSLMVDLDAEARGMVPVHTIVGLAACLAALTGCTICVPHLKPRPAIVRNFTDIFSSYTGRLNRMGDVFTPLHCRLARSLVIYPSQHLQVKLLRHQAVSSVKQSDTDVGIDTAQTVDSDMAVARVQICNTQQPHTISPASDFIAPASFLPQVQIHVEEKKTTVQSFSAI